jgi:hypothetical protein
MPSWAKLREFGNPYPANPQADSTVLTKPRWWPYVVLAWHVWDLLVADEQFVLQTDLARVEARLFGDCRELLGSNTVEPMN